jgi:hypothetical protein
MLTSLWVESKVLIVAIDMSSSRIDAVRVGEETMNAKVQKHVRIAFETAT